MPIYEYVCNTCGHELEALQAISEPPLSDCPECGESALRKRISAAAFRLKGSGWYETDFKTSNKRNLAGDSKATGSGSKKTDHKEQSGSAGGAAKSAAADG